MLIFAQRQKRRRPVVSPSAPKSVRAKTIRARGGENPAVDSILNLQRTIGNYRVYRLLTDRPLRQSKWIQAQAVRGSPLQIDRDTPQYWFQSKPPEKATVTEGGVPITPKGQVVLDLTKHIVPIKDLGISFTVQFAGLDSDFRAGKPTQAMSRGEGIVLDAIKKVVEALGTLPEKQVSWEGGATRAEVQKHKAEAYRKANAERLQDTIVRARLKEIFRALNNRTLNIFIASDLTIGEKMAPGRPALKTQQIFVRPDDINDRKKLEAAIRIPLVNLIGGDIGVRPDGKGGLQATTAKPFTEAESKEAVLHEFVHVLLINRSASASQLWESIGPKLVSGPPAAKDLCESLLRRYLRAQEEVFVYEEVGKVTAEFSQNKQMYDTYIQLVEAFLSDLSAKPDQNKIIKLDVSEKVAKKKVDWNVSYRFPKSVTVKAEHVDILKKLVAVDPGT